MGVEDIHLICRIYRKNKFKEHLIKEVKAAKATGGLVIEDDTIIPQKP